MVSFIIPVYNTEKYIKRCIDSVLNQIDTDFELILINDGSTDNSPNICEVYSKKYENITLIHQENQGVSVARQNGLSKAKGDWVAFVDSDDSIGDTYSQLVNENKNGFDLICFSENFSTNEYIFEGNKEIYIKEILSLENTEFSNNNLKTVWDKAYNRNFLNENNINFTQGVFHGEDVLFNMEVAIAANKILFKKSKLYFQENNPNSITNSYHANLVSNEINYYKRLDEILFKTSDYKHLSNSINFLRKNSLWFVIVSNIYSEKNTCKLKEKRKTLKQIFDNEIYKNLFDKGNYR